MPFRKAMREFGIKGKSGFFGHAGIPGQQGGSKRGNFGTLSEETESYLSMALKYKKDLDKKEVLTIAKAIFDMSDGTSQKSAVVEAIEYGSVSGLKSVAARKDDVGLRAKSILGSLG